jgi:hypothetical protein
MGAIFMLGVMALIGCASPMEKAEALVTQAEAAVVAGDPDEADHLYVLALEHEPVPKALCGRAELMVARGEVREAHQLLIACKGEGCDASRMKSAKALVAQLEQAGVPEAEVSLYLEAQSSATGDPSCGVLTALVAAGPEPRPDILAAIRKQMQDQAVQLRGTPEETLSGVAMADAMGRSMAHVESCTKAERELARVESTVSGMRSSMGRPSSPMSAATESSKRKRAFWSALLTARLDPPEAPPQAAEEGAPEGSDGTAVE